ncbi:Potassium/sodium hyperpolarization-activated cyclic nucleotide-gated channel 1 [Hondaea fermentalgiana]|uniref:Potassium/sodium hyperpolarization-activated cyclic nucleotide-gated channel 1 n=1 Tax=Hondaea fermentalgiana TaxID=2315210 RepID=A0A2R5GM83_9STRA|nr:Potassium/sodium hyperpolarization-activated cyclic nucleotide-gated channel 1 [Hondaea fermentalgiana]|eukprot:GBG29401.1 Potassium/sodium hyperpolarization-activated cyclic nucleotide-gated channel 1 [Hondaea fermentalgiana]
MIQEQRFALEEQRKLLQRMEEMQLRLERLARTGKAGPRQSALALGSLGQQSECATGPASNACRPSFQVSEADSRVEPARHRLSVQIAPKQHMLQRSLTTSNINEQTSSVRDADCAITSGRDAAQGGRRRSVHGLAGPVEIRRLSGAGIGPARLSGFEDQAGNRAVPKVFPSDVISTDALHRNSMTLDDALPSRRKPSVRGKHFDGLARLKLQIEGGYRMVVTDEEDSGDEEVSDAEEDEEGGTYKLGGDSMRERPRGRSSGAPELSNQHSGLDVDSESLVPAEGAQGKRQTSSYEDNAVSAIRTSILASGKRLKTVSGETGSFKYKTSSAKQGGAGRRRRRQKSFLSKYNPLNRLPVLHPESSFRAKWNLFVLCMLLWYSFTIPFSISFSISPYGLWRIIEILFDVAFGVDILLNFITGYYTKRQSVQLIVMNHRMIVKNYVMTWLLVDLIAITPFDIIVTLLTTGSTVHAERSVASLSKLIRLVKLTRLLRLVGLYRYFKYWSDRLKPGMLRLGTSLIVILLVIHLLACFFFYLSDLDPTRVDTWSDEYGVRHEDLAFPKYIASLYWSITTMTTVGYGDIVPQNEGEIFFVIIAMLISCSMFAYSVGNVASMVSAIDSTQTMYKEKMDWLKEYCSQQALPEELQTRIRAYYSHCWKDLKSFPFSEHAILDDLSPALRREVVLFLNRDMVDKVPFFQGQDDNFICRLILCMTAEVCAPLDMIIRQGEVGKAMYFVRRGLVEVCNADATEIYTTLSDGCYFGEISLLVGGRRTASVRAIFHSSLFRLEQDDLDNMLLDYPEALQKILHIAATSRYQLTEAEHESLQSRFQVFSSVLGNDNIRSGGGMGVSDEEDDLHGEDADNIGIAQGESTSFGKNYGAQDRNGDEFKSDDAQGQVSGPIVAGRRRSSTLSDANGEEGEDTFDSGPLPHPLISPLGRPNGDSAISTARSTVSSSPSRAPSLARMSSSASMSSQAHIPLGTAVLERAKSMSPKTRQGFPMSPKSNDA